MRKIWSKALSVFLALVLVASAVCPTLAATYRPGAQSGPSSSYAGGIYYQNFRRVPITGDNRTDLIAIALSQLGYQEGKANGYFSGTVAGSSNYVEYSYNMGDLGLGYGGSDYPWCACFVSWCLYQSHCTDQNTWKDLGRYHVGDYKYIWKEISCSQWVRQLKGAGYYKYSAYEGGSYTPKAGDLVFFQNSGGVAHIGICLYTSGGRIYTVEGNTSDSSGLETNGGGVYFKNYSLSTSYINGYGVLPYVSDSSVTKIDYSGNNPTPGLYVANATKYIYGSETDTSYDYLLPRFTMFEVTQVCSNGRLKIEGKCSTGETVTGYISNNSDRVIQLSTTETGAVDTARANLQSVVKDAANIRHYNYAEAKILEIREAYNTAVALIANTAATEAELTAAAATLRNLMGQTGSNTIALNNQGIYINGRNGVIKAGDCFIYSNLWNDGLITVDNANIRYTLNVVCGWDAEQEINVVKSISYGSGNATPSIQLGEAEFLIACHNWETGIADSDNPVEYSGTNYAILAGLEVGDRVKLSGATALNANSDVAPGAFLKFMPKESTIMSAENTYVDSSKTVLFTPDFNSGVLTSANANIGSTLNLLVQWDNERSAWVIADKFSGSSSVTITDGQVVIACHKGTSVSTQYNYNQFNTAQVGQKVIFSGISPTDGTTNLSTAANVSFVDIEDSSGEETDSIAPENLALNKDYVALDPGTAAHIANLTDGTYITGMNTTGGWFGFLGVAESANCNTDADGVGHVTIDLGNRYKLSSFRAHFFKGDSGASIGLPSSVNVYVSSDNVNFNLVGELTLTGATGTSDWAVLDGTAVAGRYVRFDVGASEDAAWVFLNELEVYGNELTASDNIALGTAQQGTPSSGYNASLTDGITGTEPSDGAWYGVDTFTGSGSVIIDLGSRYQISGIRTHIYSGDWIAAPTSIAVSVSADGTNYATAGYLPLSSVAEPFWSEIAADTMVGRYVKLEAISSDSIVLLSEIEVYGTPYVQTGDNNIAMGKDTIVSSYADSPFTALLNDSIASDVFQYNVNNSAWFAFKNTGDAATGNVTNDRGIITMDLGGQAEITGVSLHLFAGTNDAGAVQPQYVNVYYSTDGIAYDYAGYITPDTAKTEAYWLSADYSGAPVTARYIKFALGTSTGDLILLNEIKVNGLMLTTEGDDQPGAISNVTLAGSFNNWNSTPNMVNVDESTVTATMSLEAGSHEFKILYCNQWLGNNGTITDSTGGYGWTMELNTNNCVLNATKTGVYRFTFSKETSQVWVAYVPDTLYLRGSFNEWGTTHTMTDEGYGIYSTTLSLDGGTHEFKIANEDYSSEWPASNYVLSLDYHADVNVKVNIMTGEVMVDTVYPKATITFTDYDGTVLSSEEVEYGVIPTAPADPTRADDGSYSYTFSGWTPEISAVTGDATYAAVYTATPLVVVPTLTAKNISLSFEDEILVNVYFTAANTADVKNYGLLLFSEKVANPTFDTAIAHTEGWYESNGYLGVTTPGIAAKNMGDTLYFAVYAVLADGSYAYTKTYSYAPTNYAYNMLGKASTSAGMKSLIVAMLNYGAAAQEYFNYNTENLVNANLTDEQKALVVGYDNEMLDGLATCTADKKGELFGNGNTGFNKRTPSVNFEGAFSVNFYFSLPKATVGSDVTFYVWDKATYESVDTLLPENAVATSTCTFDGTYYAGIVEGIAAKQVDETFYCAAVFTGEDGNTYVSGVISYSLGYYLENQANGTKMPEFAQATGVYAYYAKTLFNA